MYECVKKDRIKYARCHSCSEMRCDVESTES